MSSAMMQRGNKHEVLRVLKFLSYGSLKIFGTTNMTAKRICPCQLRSCGS